MSEVKITDARETVDFDGKKLTRKAIYEFTIDGKGPFTAEFPAGEDTKENLQAAIDKKKVVLDAFK